MIGLLVRLPLLASPMTLDEMGQIAVARGSLLDLLAGVRTHAAAAPLDYVGTKLVSWFPDPTIGPRLWPLLVGVVAIPIAYGATRALTRDHAAALLAAAGVAAAPFLIAFSAVARFYALPVDVALLSIWATARLVDQPSRTRWLAWGIGAVTTFYAHYPLTGLVALEAVYLFRLREWRIEIGMLAGVVLACLPWALYAIPAQMAIPWIHYPVPPFDAVFVRENLTAMLAPAAPLVVPVLVVLAAIGAWAFRCRPIWPVVAFAIVILPASWLSSVTSGFYFDARHAIELVPLVLVIAACGLAAVLHRWPVAAVLVTATLAIGFASSLASTLSAHPILDDWAAASSWVESEATTDVRIGSTVDEGWAYGIAYYAPEFAGRTALLSCEARALDIIVDATDSYGRSIVMPAGWMVRSFGPSLRVGFGPASSSYRLPGC